MAGSFLDFQNVFMVVVEKACFFCISCFVFVRGIGSWSLRNVFFFLYCLFAGVSGLFLSPGVSGLANWPCKTAIYKGKLVLSVGQLAWGEARTCFVFGLVADQIKFFFLYVLDFACLLLRRLLHLSLVSPGPLFREEAPLALPQHGFETVAEKEILYMPQVLRHYLSSNLSLCFAT